MRTWPTLLVAASMAVAWLAVAEPASAQLRGLSIRIVVPTAAGGAADAVARLMGQRLQEGTGTTVLVENKAGGLFAPAMRDVVNSPPDGSTIFMVTTSVLMSQILHPEIPYDLTRDYTPIIAVATGPLIMVGRKDLPFRDVAGLVAHAKRNPGKLVFASPGGNGSAFMLAVTLLISTTGIDALNVPYKSGAPALNDLLGGHVDLMFDAMPVEVGQVLAGNVIGFMVTGPTRVSTLPQVPSAPEAGSAFSPRPRRRRRLWRRSTKPWRGRLRVPMWLPNSNPRELRRSAARRKPGRPISTASARDGANSSPITASRRNDLP